MHSFKIINAVDSLSVNPHPRNSKKPFGSNNGYRIRVGSYRVVYIIYGSELVIEIVRVSRRKVVYR